MLRNALIFCAFFIASLLIQAPATVWDSWLQGSTRGQLALLDTTGSLWHGEARFSVRDATSGARIPLTPISWKWQPLDIVRARITWGFSIAGLQPFTLNASPFGIEAKNVAIALPVRQVLDIVPNAVARAGWHGDFSFNADRWQCGWAGKCNGHAELFWRGAASDLFPGREFGDYKLVADAQADNTSLLLSTVSGAIKLNANGQISANGVAKLQGSVEGDPSFVGRLPDVANRWVTRTSDPGRMLFNFDSSVLNQ